MSTLVQEDWIKVGPRRLSRMRTATAGPPLVMLHGVTRSWKTFSPLLASLSVGRQVYGVDFCGHGGSDRSSGGYRVIDYVPDALGLLLGQVDEAAVLYGHSLGAMVAAAVAAEAPQLVRAVILEDPPFETMGSRIGSTPLVSYFRGVQSLAGSNRSVAELSQAMAALQLVDPLTGKRTPLSDLRDAASIRFSAKCLQRLDPETLTPVVAGEWTQGYYRDDIFSRIQCPVLLLQADQEYGGMLTDKDAAELKQSLADCTHVKLRQASHLLHWTRTQDLLNLVLAFLGSLEHSGSAAPRVAPSKEIRV